MVINSCTLPRGRGYTVFAKQCGTYWFYQEWDRDLKVALRYSCAWMALFDLITQMHFERSHHIPVKSSWPYTATQHERINNKARIKKFDGIAAKLPSVNPTSHYVGHNGNTGKVRRGFVSLSSSSSLYPTPPPYNCTRLSSHTCLGCAVTW